MLVSAMLGAGTAMLGDIVGVVFVWVLVWAGLSGFLLVYLPDVLKEHNFDEHRTQGWVRAGLIGISVGCLLGGWWVYPEKAQTYTIPHEGELEFVQALRTVEYEDADIEIHAAGDAKASTLAKRMSALFESRGWNVRKWSIAIPKDLPPGVTIWASKDAAAAGLLKALLTKYNIETRIQRPAPGEELPYSFASLRIFVGPES